MTELNHNPFLLSQHIIKYFHHWENLACLASHRASSNTTIHVYSFAVGTRQQELILMLDTYQYMYADIPYACWKENRENRAGLVPLNV
jgi:hypothetical protein